MESAGIGSIFKLLLVLFLSVKDAPQNTGRAPELEILAPAGAVGYAVLDVAQVRALIREDPELAKALFDGRTPEAAYGEAIEAMSARTRVEPAALRDAVARVRVVGIWSLGMAARRQPRFVALFDRGGAADILPKLLESHPEDAAETTRSLTYAGHTLYAVGRDPREALWLAEADGMLLLASDALAAETLLLRLRAPADASALARPVAAAARRPLLQIRADVGAVVNGFLPAMGDHDRAEFMAAGAFVDLPAWRGASLSVERDRVVLRAEIDPGSPMAVALQQPPRLDLIDAIPSDAGLAGIVSVRDAAGIWDLAEAGFSHIAIFERGRTGAREEFIRDFSRSTGLDVQTDLVSNLVAVAVILTDPARGLNLKRGGALLFEGKDPARTRAALQTLRARIGDPADPEEQQGVQVWRTDETLIALKGNVVLVAPCRGDAQVAAERLLKHFVEGGESLRKVLATSQPGATTCAAVDAARCFPQAGLERLTAGLTVDAAGLTLRVEGGGRNLAAGVLRLMFDVGSKASAQANQARAMNSLRQVAMACQMYAMDYGKLPAMLTDLKPYVGDTESILRDARSGEFYRLNPAVAGRSLDSVKQPNATVLVYAATGPDAATRSVAFCDGSVRLMTPAHLEAALEDAIQTE